MKKALLLLLITAACQPKQTTTEASQLMASAPKPALITIDNASELISNYLMHPRIELRNYTLGGAFPVADFTPDVGNEGLLMWYCFDALSKQVFMAVEPYVHYDTAKLPQAPIQPVLRKPESTFLYNGPSPSKNDVMTFLLDQKLTGPSTELDNATATRYVKSFDSLMSKTIDDRGEPYQKYPFNYFIWGADYKTFVSWAGADGYIRYYLAYGEKYKSNRIRIVLFATDKDGNTKTGIQLHENSGGQGLQNGWPPPPPII
jgi:hypothetical protein